MDIWSWLESTNAKITLIAAGFLAVSGILEKVSGLKLWSWLLRWVGDRTNATLAGEVMEVKKQMCALESKTDTRFDALEKSIRTVEENVYDARFKSVKKEILDFAGALMNGKAHSKEQFAHILEVIDEYETVFAENHNGETKQTIQFIRNEYSSFMLEKRTKNKKEKEK